MRISDWSSDVCSSDLSGVVRPGSCGRWPLHENGPRALPFEGGVDRAPDRARAMHGARRDHCRLPRRQGDPLAAIDVDLQRARNHEEQLVRLRVLVPAVLALEHRKARSEEHTSELQSLMRISYAVFCLKKKKKRLTTRQEND